MSKEVQLIPKTTDWYEGLTSELQAALIETRKSLSFFVIEQKHTIGEIIVRNMGFVPEGVGVTELIRELALDLGVSERVLWHSKEFYELTGHDLNAWMLAEPGNEKLNWTSIRTKYLSPPKEESETTHTPEEEIALRIIKRFGKEKARVVAHAILDLGA